MSCPKCKAKVGVVKLDIIMESGVVPCRRCLICGFLEQPYQPRLPRSKTGNARS